FHSTRVCPAEAGHCGARNLLRPAGSHYFGASSCFVIFLCFLYPDRCDDLPHGYDCSNGMWGETDDETKWKPLSAMFLSAALAHIPELSKSIPKARRPASC